MQRLSGPTVDVGVPGACGGISILMVFWWVFFMESLTGTGPVSGMPSLGALA